MPSSTSSLLNKSWSFFSGLMTSVLGGSSNNNNSNSISIIDDPEAIQMNSEPLALRKNNEKERGVSVMNDSTHGTGGTVYESISAPVSAGKSNFRSRHSGGGSSNKKRKACEMSSKFYIHFTIFHLSKIYNNIV